MSTWAALHETLHRLDHTIINKLEVLVNNQLSNEEYMDPNTYKLLEDPLIFSNFENYDFTDFPRENLFEVIDILKKEKIELTRVFNEVNRERKTLRQQNLKLMERLFTMENFDTEKIDRDFNSFISKTFFVHYELSKKFVEMERKKNEDLTREVEQKKDEIQLFVSKVAQLEEKLLQTRGMLKKSILEGSTPTNLGSNHSHNNSIFTPKFPIIKSPTASGSGQMGFSDLPKQSNGIEIKKQGLFSQKINVSTIENDVEASINDKILNKIKELKNGRASPINKNFLDPCNTSNRSILLDKSLLGLTIHEDNFSEIDDDHNRHTPLIINLKSDTDLDNSKILTGKLNKTNIDTTSSKGSPKKKPSVVSKADGKSPYNSTTKSTMLSRSSSQKTFLPQNSKLKSPNSKLDKNNKLNHTINYDPNISIDNLNTTILSTADNDPRKSYSDQKKKPSYMSSKASPSTNSSNSGKTKSPQLGAKTASTIGSLSSPKGQTTKPRFSINSNPVPVKKK